MGSFACIIAARTQFAQEVSIHLGLPRVGHIAEIGENEGRKDREGIEKEKDLPSSTSKVEKRSLFSLDAI